MDGPLATIIGIVLALVLLDLAALRFGYDSRDGRRELPLVAAPDPSPPRPKGHRVRIRWRGAMSRDGWCARRFEPRALRSAHAYVGLGLGAAGK